MIGVLPSPLSTPSQRRPQRAFNALKEISRALLGWRKHYGFGWFESAITALYCAVLALAIPHHEPWSDEAQAWFLSGNNSVWQMFRYRMHYEGAPALWHILLHSFQLAHGTFGALNWLGAAFAVAGVVVFLRCSPFPVIIRALLPFTFFIQYQYAVIARSYNLFPLLVFTLCALYGKRSRLIWFALTAGLLANLSMQGIEVASVLSALYLYDLYREHRLGYSVPQARLVASGVVFGVLALVAVYEAIPAPDVNFAISDTVSDGAVHRLLVRVIGETKPVYSAPPLPGPWVPPFVEPPEPSALSHPADWTAWNLDHHSTDSAGHSLPQPWYIKAAAFLVGSLSEATWPIANSNLLAIIFLGLLVGWLWERHSVRFLLPWLAIVLVGQVIWVAEHHAGMMFIAVVAAAWIGAKREPARQPSSALNAAFIGAFALVLLLQVGWAAYSLKQDIDSSYDPGRETAAYLNAHPVPRTAAFNYWSTSMQPYFAHNPFFNIPTRYRIWSAHTNPDPYYQETLTQHPDRIVYSAEFPGTDQMHNQWVPLTTPLSPELMRSMPWDQAVLYFRTHGYVETHRFCGKRFVRFGYSFIDCDLIFDPAQPSLTTNSPRSSRNAE